MQPPSLSNTSGTFLGVLAGGLVAANTASIPFVIAGAAALGLTPVGLAGVLGIGVTALVNYGVTHWAEVANLNDLAKTWWPQIEGSYPTAKGITDTPPSVQAWKDRGPPGINQ